MTFSDADHEAVRKLASNHDASSIAAMIRSLRAKRDHAESLRLPQRITQDKFIKPLRIAEAAQSLIIARAMERTDNGNQP